MPRKGGWRREGSRGRFRYVDARGKRITDEEKLERIKSLVIPPAWKDVWVAPSASAKLQATGVDAAGRKQYFYDSSFRAEQERRSSTG
jgi:DNA topoisomerase-1